MTSQVQDVELLEAIDKILQKSQEDVRRKILTLISRREKHIVKIVQKSTKGESKGESRHKKIEPERKNPKKVKESYHRSRSSSGEESN